MARTSIAWSLTWRTAAASLAIVVSCGVASYGIVSTTIDAAVERSAKADLAALVDVYASGGQNELVRRIGDRTGLRSRGGDAAYAALVINGRIEAGNLTTVPDVEPQTSQARFATVGDDDLFVAATAVAPDVDLYVAHDLTSLNELRQNLLLAIIGSIALLGLLLAYIAGRSGRMLARDVDRINAAYRNGDTALLKDVTNNTRTGELGELARFSSDAIERLDEMVREQRHISDQIAHEVRTPLHHLDGRLSKLSTQIRGEDAAHEIDGARSDIKSIAALLDSLLDIAANEANRGSTDGMAQFDLSALAKDLAELYQASFEEAGLTFNTAITPNVKMTGIAMQIQRLISNLLDNTIKYVPAPGSVTLMVSDGPVVTVYDDGPGIPAEQRAAIFERFRRGRAGDSVKGHGLGLALAKAIATRHRLSLVLEPSDVGSRFVLRGDRT